MVGIWTLEGVRWEVEIGTAGFVGNRILECEGMGNRLGIRDLGIFSVKLGNTVCW
jgi:hypothetical protein